jgi:hypothetical protein
VCVVLDPNTTDLDGKRLPARLSPTGPVVFQVRMPKFQDAALMKIYRLSGPSSDGPGLEPTGTLHASISSLRPRAPKVDAKERLMSLIQRSLRDNQEMRDGDQAGA